MDESWRLMIQHHEDWWFNICWLNHHSSWWFNQLMLNHYEECLFYGHSRKIRFMAVTDLITWAKFWKEYLQSIYASIYQKVWLGILQREMQAVSHFIKQTLVCYVGQISSQMDCEKMYCGQMNPYFKSYIEILPNGY